LATQLHEFVQQDYARRECRRLAEEEERRRFNEV
jgi:hypothetical protein